MKFFEKNRDYILTAFFLIILPFIYLMVYGRYGYDITDTAFMRGYSTALINGKKLGSSLLFPFHGTIYITSLIQYLFADFKYLVLLDRFLFYFSTALISVVSYKTFKQVEEKVGVATTILSVSLIFLLNTSNFPAALSYTILSTLFAVLGWYFFKNNSMILAGFLSYFAIQCKVNFILFLLFLILVTIRRCYLDKKFIRLVHLSLGILICAIIFYCLKITNLHFSIQNEFFASSLKNNFRKMYVSGFSAYALNYYVTGFFVAILTHFIRNDYFKKIYLVTIFCTLFVWSYFRIDSNTFFPYAIGPGIVLFNFTVGRYLVKNINKLKNLNFMDDKVFQFIVLGWVSSLSDTQPGPWLLVGTFLFIFIEQTKENFHFSKKILSIIVIALVIINHKGSENLYRNGRRINANINMASTHSSYSGVMTNKEMIEKINDLKSITKNLSSFHVLPSFSDANYILGKKLCLPIVWDITTGTGEEKKVFKEEGFHKKSLLNCKNIIIEKNIPTKYTTFTNIVKGEWHKAGENGSFYLYSPVNK